MKNATRIICPHCKKTMVTISYIEVKIEPKLWLRHYDCGHSRETNIAFMAGEFKKPKVGSIGYCRECMEDRKIVKVERIAP